MDIYIYLIKIIKNLRNYIVLLKNQKKQKASEMLASGNYLWNSGIFLFSVKDIINAFENFSNNTLKNVRASLENGNFDLDFRLEKNSWSKSDDISIDYAILEKVNNLSVVPFEEMVRFRHMGCTLG